MSDTHPKTDKQPDEEPVTEPLLEEEPPEYEMPEPAPRKAESEKDAGSEPPRVEEPTPLPTSDPVFPTASPQLKPPTVPADAERPDPSSAGPAAAPASPGGASAAPPARPVGPGGVPARPLGPPTPRPPRSAAEIRADIEAGRQELSQSVEVLRDKVNDLTDWRGQIRKHRREITVAAAVVGFAVGARFMMRRRRRS